MANDKDNFVPRIFGILMKHSFLGSSSLFGTIYYDGCVCVSLTLDKFMNININTIQHYNILRFLIDLQSHCKSNSSR